MNFLVECHTDVGIKKTTNQDSFSAKIADTSLGKVVFVVLCDGMGGLAKGELASATVVNAFCKWFTDSFPILITKGITAELIREEWEKIVFEQNGRISNYGKKNNVSLGTTLTVMLIVNDIYYIVNVGDSRAYEITDYLRQITKDHTLVAREVERGNLTQEQAQSDPRKNILLQCVGASNVINVDFFTNRIKKNSVYFISSDGFRNRISPQEIFEAFNPSSLVDENTIKENAIRLVELGKSRMEKDNISVVVVKSY